MMNNFIEKMREDKKYKAKAELMIYGAFMLIVFIYALIVNNKNTSTESLYNSDSQTNENIIVDTKKPDTINIPNEYNYIITINDNEKIYKYSGRKTTNEMTITKETNDKTQEYLYKDNNYYELIDNVYINVSKEEIYDLITYNYIDLNNINTYLSKATQNGNNYIVYLKDIVLNNESNNYITINMTDDIIDIDYTELIKLTKSNIEKYLVTIKLEEIE